MQHSDHAISDHPAHRQVRGMIAGTYALVTGSHV